MKTFKILLFLPLLLFSFCSSKPGETNNDAGEQTEGGQRFKVYGKVTNYAGATLILNEATPQGMRPLDTSNVNPADGSFAFEGFLREKSLAIINLGQQFKNVFLVIDTTSEIKLNIDAGPLLTYTVENSAESKEIKKIADLNTEYNKKIMDLDASYNADPMMGMAKRQEIEAQVQLLVGELQSKLSAEVPTLKSPLAQIFAIELMQVSVDMKTEQEVIEAVKKQPTNKWFTYYLPNAEKRMALAVGAQAPDLQLKDTTGKTVSLSSLQGKYVMIDFWASWCKPCRAENPHVVKLYNTYKNKGFEIYGVSLDNNPAAWRNAITADGLTWVHVSDLGGWQSSAAKVYNINSIPQTLLIDKKGKIIAKGLRGAQLEEKLKTLLN